MSCDDPHGAHCADVLAEVWLFLDQECDEERGALLAQHLEDCQPCLAEYGLEEKLKKLLATKCGGEHAPTQLRDKLRRQIQVAVLDQAEVTMATTADGTVTTTVEIHSERIEQRG